MRAVARFKDEIWCLDLEDVVKLAKDHKGIKYLLVRQDFFEGTVDAKGMKIKDAKETVRTFSNFISRKNRPEKTGVDQGTGFDRQFKIFYSADGLETYSTTTETKSVYTEHTKRLPRNFCVATWRIMGTSMFIKYLNKLQQ